MSEHANARAGVPEHLRSIHVQPQSMDWRATKFDGCEMKPLYVDKETGVLTVLLRMAPGATLPDHEHVFVEQTYMLEGRLEDKEGPEKGLSVSAGETSPGRRAADTLPGAPKAA